MARLRHYFTYDEALAEWRRYGLPETFNDRKRLLGNLFVIEDGLDLEALDRLHDAVVRAGGEAHLCRKSKSPRLMISAPPSFFDHIGLVTNEDATLTLPLQEAVRNYHSDYVPPVHTRRRTIRFDKTLVMGILNLTPDSFSDGGKYFYPLAAVARAKEMVEQGADIIDIGAESTRPGARPISLEEEWARLEPVLHDLVDEVTVPISVDTRHAAIAERALALGAEMINDVSTLREEDMAKVVKDHQAALIIMHMRGDPENMQEDVRYDDLVGEIFTELQRALARARSQGLSEENVIIDPGLGFGKKGVHNLELIRRLREFHSLGRPVLLGASRKNFIGTYSGGGPLERLEGSLAAAVMGVMNGANIVRVHDVAETVRALRLTDAVVQAIGRPY